MRHLKMKKICLILTLIVCLTGCSISGQAPSGTVYSAGADEQRGLYIEAKPPFWDSIVIFMKPFFSDESPKE